MTFADDVTADSPYVWWDTRQAPSTFQPDRSGNNRSGTVVGTPAVSSDGLTFDNTATGADQWVVSDADVVAISDTFATWAFEIVVSASSWPGGFQGLLMLDDWPDEADTTGLFTHISSGRAATTLGTGLGFIHQSANTSATNALIHLLADFDGANVTLYRNGVVDFAVAGSSLAFDRACKMILAGDAFTVNGSPGGDGFTGLLRHGIFYGHDLGPTRAAIHAADALGDDPFPPVGPSVSDVSPASGFTTGNEPVAVSGAGFTGASSVLFGAEPAASFSGIDDGTIHAITPIHAAGTVTVSVEV